MDDTYFFNKTAEDRLNYYSDLFKNEKTVSPSLIKKEWSFYLELAMECSGWRALWKIPRDQCMVYEIQYPNVAIVYVNDVSFETLTAKVKILAVKNDTELPDVLEVDLINLFPTIEQDESIALNMPLTAESLDMFRFFYNYIWMPWDDDEDECVDWINLHLEFRIKLYFDLKSGVIPRSLAIKIRRLVNEAKNLMDKIRMLEVDDKENELDEMKDPYRITELAQAQTRLVQIRTEFELYENPDIRSAFITRCQKENNEKQINKYWLVFTPKTVDKQVEYLRKYEKHSTNVAETATSLKEALKRSSSGDTIFLADGNYVANNLDNLESNGKIIGLFESFETVITDDENINTFFEIFGSNSLENVTINLSSATIGIAVRKGELLMKNCILEGIKSNRREGIIVYPGAKLIMENCRVHGFSFAVVCKPGASVRIEDSLLSRNGVGIMLYDKSLLELKRSTISQCTMYGICLESEHLLTTITNLDMLNSIKEISVVSTKINENVKGDIKIQKKLVSISQIQKKFTEDDDEQVKQTDSMIVVS